MSEPPSRLAPDGDPLVTFYRCIPQTRLPQRADRAAIGTLPTRAFRYCEPVVTAAGFGYYVFPPINFSLLWDGSEVIWTWEGEAEWFPLDVAQYPGFRSVFEAAAPEEIRPFAPPFLGALSEPGIVQVWSGLIARTPPGWSLLVRPLANLPRSQNFELYEGIVETDRWFGPLFTNLRLTKTDIPIAFRKDYPLFQVQPIPRAIYDEPHLNSYTVVADLAGLGPADWDDFYDTVVRPNVQENRPRGQYAIAARKRQRGEPTPD